MASSVDVKTCIVIPNWNGKDELPACLDSLLAQSLPAELVVVENGSADGSLELLAEKYPQVTVLAQPKNLGFAGGVNVGIRYALEKGYDFVALFNNDALAKPDWLQELVGYARGNATVGIATSKFLSKDGKHLDSTGDYYTVWGLPYPRGRDESDTSKYDNQTEIFGASGGASLYRLRMLQQIGLFDEDFFAYYEDVDISFRAQLAGWKVAYVPTAVAYHDAGTTSGKIKGFTTYQTLKNLPLLMWKNVPTRLMVQVWPRHVFAWYSFAFSALLRGQFTPVLKGAAVSIALWPKKLVERYRIQKSRTVSDEYIWNLLVHDLPPNARKLRALRSAWWKVRGKS